jgi:hypothetical protein
MQLQGRSPGLVMLDSMGKATRHGFHRASLALPAKGRSTSILIHSARPASTARCFSPFSSSDTRFLAREFMSGSFLVRGASALRGDRTLCLRIHRCKPARRFSYGASTARISTVVTSFVRSFVDSAHSAPLLKPVA